VILRHIVLMKFPGGVESGWLDEMHAAVEEMAERIPEVLASSGGLDVSGKDENFDYAIILDFADREAYERYRVHQMHQDFIARFIKGRTIEKVRIQLSLPQVP